jgi:hypothetical protein
VQIDATRTLTVSSLFRPEQNDVVPLIRLSGRWLATIVRPGQRVTVAIDGSSITITPTTDGQEDAQRCSELLSDAQLMDTIQLELPLV